MRPRLAGQQQCVIAQIVRPRGQFGLETGGIGGKQGAASLLETRPIPPGGGDEAIAALVRGAADILLGVLVTRGIDQFAQRYGSASGLRIQPLPMTWQQGDFARHHAQTRTATATFFLRLYSLIGQGQFAAIELLDDFGRAAAQIEVDHAGIAVIENQQLTIGPCGKCIASTQGDMAQLTGGYAAIIQKRGAASIRGIAKGGRTHPCHYFTRTKYVNAGFR